MSEDIRIDYTNLLADAVGPDHGVTREEVGELQIRAREIHRDLQARLESGELGFYSLPYQPRAAKEIETFAKFLRARYDNFVVLGIGGSALGAIALRTALCHPLHNMVSKKKRGGGMRLFVLDNVDPDEFRSVIETLDPKKTIVNVVTKSGTTAETLSQFMIVTDRLRSALKSKWKKRVVVTTDPQKGPLREIANQLGLHSFEVPEGVGGRFSVLTAVGLLPLATAGVDIQDLLAGAARMEERCRTDSLEKNPAYFLASLLYLLDTRKGKKIAVMMPYSAGLKDLADWFRQLWAESLGKRLTVTGEEVYAGQTPVKALGVTDQHSQLQLYAEGPNDKVILFLEAGRFAGEVPIPDLFPDQDKISYLSGHTLNRLIQVEKEGTELALTLAKRPNCTLRLDRISPHTLGQLMFLFEVQTAFAGGLYRVNAFDQPGVEEGKKYANAMLGKPGSEEDQKRYESLLKSSPRKIFGERG
jgi:glucose-6-phosphate isomerase